MKKTICSVVFLILSICANAKISLPRVIDSKMVLQQNTEVKLWGWSDQKEVIITTSWNDKKYEVKVRDGSWQTKVATQEGGYTPQSLKFSDCDSEIELDDILIGEVWICSGQSNMEMPLRGNRAQPVRNGLENIMHSGEMAGRIRFITVPKDYSGQVRNTFSDGYWQQASPASTLLCSAAAWYFANHVTRSLNIPVGLVINPVGGSQIEAWMSEEALQRVEGLNLAEAKSEKFKPHHRATMLYNTMHIPVRGYTAKGFLWYQGESNVFNAKLYPALMREMVSLWRNEWDNQEMPFIYVQIAPYRYKGSDRREAAFLREAQEKALHMIPDSWMIPTTDVGNEDCIHPAQKDVVGMRLAAMALSKVYKVKGIPADGPRMKSVKYADGKAVVTFDFDTSAMGLYPNMTQLEGFEVAGSDRVFYPAKATIIGRSSEVEVWSEEVAEPVAVRYAFCNFTPCITLSNIYGIAAFPFRTDDWDE